MMSNEFNNYIKSRPLKVKGISADLAMDAYAPVGKKDDKGKLRYSLLTEGMPKGLEAVVEVLEYGAIKYEPHNWQKVEGGIERYKEALLRHVNNKEGLLLARDSESGLLHLAHIACNALFLLELLKGDIK